MAARKSRTAPLEAILDEIATLDAESAEVLANSRLSTIKLGIPPLP